MMNLLVLFPSLIHGILVLDTLSTTATAFLPTTKNAFVFTKTTTTSSSSRDEYDDFYADFDPSIEYPTTSSTEKDDSFSYSNRGGRERNQPFRQRDGTPRQRNNKYDSSDRQSSYQRDTSRDNSNVNVEIIQELIVQRDQARRRGQFDQADQIRNTLLNEHGVQVWDRDRIWRSGCSASGSGRNPPQQSSRFNNNNNRSEFDDNNSRRRGDRGERTFSNRKSFSPLDFGENGHDYTQVSSTIIVSNLSEPEIHERIAQRLQCKLSRRFREADQIQQELANHGVYVHDGRKEWRADGESFGGMMDNRGGKPGQTPGSRRSKITYQPSEYSNHLSSTTEQEVIQTIEQLVNQRIEAKLSRDYETADAIRDDLLNNYDVYLDDRLKQWSMGGMFFADKARSPRRYDREDDRNEKMSSASNKRTAFVVKNDEEGRQFRRSNEVPEISVITKNSVDNDTTTNDDDQTTTTTTTTTTMEEEEEDSVATTIQYDLLSDFTVPQLKEKLRERGLPVSGKKSELIERLLATE